MATVADLAAAKKTHAEAKLALKLAEANSRMAERELNAAGEAFVGALREERDLALRLAELEEPARAAELRAAAAEIDGMLKERTQQQKRVAAEDKEEQEAATKRTKTADAAADAGWPELAKHVAQSTWQCPHCHSSNRHRASTGREQDLVTDLATCPNCKKLYVLDLIR